MTEFPLLTLVIFLPILGAIILLFVDREQQGLAKSIGLITALLTFFASLPLWIGGGRASFTFVERYVWIPDWGINYHLGVDGISMLLVMLTTFLMPIVILGAWNSITSRVKEFMIILLVLETAMIGALASLNLFLFYIFWEAMLIPMYLMIGIWGGEKRLYATMKFFIYTMVGSLLMLVALVYMAWQHAQQFGFYTFEYADLFRVGLGLNEQLILFGAFALAFAIKVPLFPLHTWLPDAHTEAPTAGSVILAGVLLKMGTYGFIRFAMPYFPQAVEVVAPYMLILSVVGIIYGALVAMVQPDMKRLIAYSSVSHLGFVMLGLFTLNQQAVGGAVIQMVNHGISTGALFLAVGIIYERRHTRLIADFGGLAARVPIFATVFLIITLSSIGLPGTNGFVGEFMILLGAFRAGADAFQVTNSATALIIPVVAALGVILAAVYMLWMYQRVMFGKLDNPKNMKMKDMTFREMAVMAPLIVAIFWIGLAPHGVMSKTDTSVRQFIQHSTGVRRGADTYYDLSTHASRAKESGQQVVSKVGDQ